MGRHADPTPHRRRPTRPVLISSGTAVVVLAGGLVWSLTGASSDARPCATQRTVAVTVAPELGDVATTLLAHPLPLASGGCAVARVTASAPLQTVGDLAALDAGSLPAVWVPDSSLWAARAQGATLTAVGSMASSPVVLATSKEAVDALGWTHTPPKWSAALTASHPVALPDLAGSATGLSALAAVRASLGGGAPADNAVVQAVLAAARSAVPNPADALASGTKGDAGAPLVPVSEQQVFAADQGTADSKLTAVYPSDGSPSLDYPVLEVGSPSGALRAAVDAVTRTLTSGAARAAVGKAGFRTGDGAAPADAGPATGIRSAAPKKLALDPKDVTALLARLSSLAAPSRILAVFDVSESMSGKAGTGTRATLSRDAASSALALFPDNSAIGLWVFARRMDGDKDYRQLLPTRTLNAQVGGQTQRAALRAALASIPNRLSPGGTGLYDTTLAAVKAAQTDYDPKAVSSVVIVTDGHDEDAGGIGMPGLITGLAAIKNPARPVKVIGIALGPDADLGALKQIADATGGAAYAALDPKDLQTVLFDALRQRG